MNFYSGSNRIDEAIGRQQERIDGMCNEMVTFECNDCIESMCGDCGEIKIDSVRVVSGGMKCSVCAYWA